ncbi:MAG: cell division ATP-binding protein FtsE [Deltaproteobacteria bacterium]|nr:cell division ATP-binding protein FtsE [Deltaproteobacteria bacterium]
MIRTFHVCKSYGARNALDDVSLHIKKGDFVFINGPSGAGKTTLLKLLYLGERATKGQILIDGANLQRINSKRLPYLRRKIGVVFQDFKLINTQTVFQNIALPLEVTGYDKKYIRKKVSYVLRMVGLENRIHSYPLYLSGGEQQRIAIARAVVNDPMILLADEPTGNLDARSSRIVLNLLRQLHTRGTTVIVATHDKRPISEPNDRAIFLDKGRIIKD